MNDRYTCLWCESWVHARGDTCSFRCYENICAALMLGTPYLKDEDVPPNDLYDQPWATRKEDENICDA